MNKKYMITRLVLQDHDYNLHAENPKEAFLNRVLELATPTKEYLKSKGIVSVSDGIIWLTNGVEFYPAWPNELWEYQGNEPVGTLIEETLKETA